MRFLMAVMIFLGGCTCHERKNTPAAGADGPAMTPDAPVVTPDTRAASRDSAQQPMPTLFDESPMGEEDMVVKVIASGAKVPVFERYDAKDASPVASITPPRGKAVPYMATKTVVQKPRVLRASKAMVLDGYVTTEAGDADKHQVTSAQLRFVKGDELSLLIYGGEGDCLVYFKGKTYWVNIFTPGQFSSPGWDGKCRAEVQQWWIKIKQGWVQVDGDRLKGKLVMWND